MAWKEGSSRSISVTRSPTPSRLGFLGFATSRWASLLWMQCMRRGYSGLEPLKKRQVEWRLRLSMSVTSRAIRFGSWV